MTWRMVDGFDYPLGAPDGDGYHVTPGGGFLDPAYYESYGWHHTGEDWNDVRGGDSDLGAPIAASAHGRVTVAAYYPGWGNIVVLEHLLPGGGRLWTQYAHMREVAVHEGEWAMRGEAIGTVGKGADERYSAHLHFEIRRKPLPANAVWRDPWQRSVVEESYHNPSEFIRSHRPYQSDEP